MRYAGHAAREADVAREGPERVSQRIRRIVGKGREERRRVGCEMHVRFDQPVGVGIGPRLPQRVVEVIAATPAPVADMRKTRRLKPGVVDVDDRHRRRQIGGTVVEDDHDIVSEGFGQTGQQALLLLGPAVGPDRGERTHHASRSIAGGSSAR
jgi:hypothetical protein